MATVNILEAKTHLSRLVDAVESGRETEVVIARNGKPAARLVAIEQARKPRRLGLANGEFKVPESLDDDPEIEAEVAKLFFGPED